MAPSPGRERAELRARIKAMLRRAAGDLPSLKKTKI